jgi:hypothetical protein
MVRWSVQPLIPPSLWLALAVVAAALLVWYALRRPSVVTRLRWTGIVGLMSVAIGLVLLLLLNPIRSEELPPPAGKPLLTVLVDATASMNTPDAGKTSRYQAAAEVASRLADRLGDRFDLRVRTFTDTAIAADAKDLAARLPAGQSTDLSTAISACLDEDRPQGQAVALLSDGAHNAGAVAGVLDAARLAKAMASPIYTETFGGDAGGFDLGLEIRSPQDLAFIGQKVLVTARVTHVGLAGSHPNVTLLQDGKEVGRERADLPEGLPGEVRFWVSRDKAGVYPYEVRVEPLPGEMTQANNVASYVLRVVDEPIHVLQIEGKPYWDSKFLMRTLVSVPAVELDSAVRISDGRILWRTIARTGGEGPATRPANAAAPAASLAAASNAAPEGERTEKWKIVTDAAAVLGSAEVLNHYQIIVIGRDAEAFLTDAGVTNLQNWISHSGGSLVCYRGSPTVQANERLARLLPVKWTPSPEARFHMKMTDQGRDLHWLADAGGAGAEGDSLPRLPTLATTALPERAKPLAVVLAKSVSGAGEESPAVVYQPYGAGRVVVVEGAGMWRWAFLPPMYQKQEEVYGMLWHSVLRWLVSGTGLMPGQKMTLRAEKLSFAMGEPAGVSLLLREEAVKGRPPSVELTNEAGGEAKAFVPSALADEPGAFHVDFGKLPEGRYRARIAGAGPEDTFSRTVFDVRRFGEEELNLKARPDLMQRIAENSGGAVLSADPVEELAAKFSEHIARVRPPRIQRTTAWDRWYVLALVLIVWGTSWYLRRAGGLV